MAIAPGIKAAWIEAQKKSSEPVNAIGVKIKPTDTATLRVWSEEGIDKYVKR
jgi:hypothetical protein